MKADMNAISRKELKLYLRFLNAYLRRNGAIVLVFVLTSCSVQNQISKDDFKIIPKDFSVGFYDRLDTIENQYDNRILTRSLIKEFTGTRNVDYEQPLQLKIEKDQLFMTFYDVSGNQFVLKFFGKLHKRKFVFYTNYETISFPILFISKETTKYSISIPSNDEILIQNFNSNEGMFLFFGAGHSWSKGYKFKLVKNE